MSSSRNSWSLLFVMFRPSRFNSGLSQSRARLTMRAVRLLAVLACTSLLFTAVSCQDADDELPPLLQACRAQVRCPSGTGYFRDRTVRFRAVRARPSPRLTPRSPTLARFLLSQLKDVTRKFKDNSAVVTKYHEMSERLTAAVTEKLDMKQEKVALKEEVAKLEEEVAKLLNRPEPGALDLCAKLATILWTSAKASAPGFVTDLADGVAEVAGPAYAKVAAVAGPAAKKTEILLRRAWRVAAPAMAAAAERARVATKAAGERAGPAAKAALDHTKTAAHAAYAAALPLAEAGARHAAEAFAAARSSASRAFDEAAARTLEKASTIDALRPHATETAARAVVALALAAPALLILWVLVGAVMRRGRISVKKSVAASSVPLRTPSPEAKKAPFAATGRTTRSSREIRSPNGDVVKFA